MFGAYPLDGSTPERGLNLQTELLEAHRNIVNDIFDCGEYAADSVNNRSIPMWKQYLRGHVACHFHIRFGYGEGTSFARRISAPIFMCFSAWV
jgi:hypothetical protein